MYCIRCQNDVAYCTCPDIEERLRSIGSHVVQATCRDCGKHADHCVCLDSKPLNLAMEHAAEEGGVLVPMSTEEICRSGYTITQPWEKKLECQTTQATPPVTPLKRCVDWVSKVLRLRPKSEPK